MALSTSLPFVVDAATYVIAAVMAGAVAEATEVNVPALASVFGMTAAALLVLRGQWMAQRQDERYLTVTIK